MLKRRQLQEQCRRCDIEKLRSFCLCFRTHEIYFQLNFLQHAEGTKCLPHNRTSSGTLHEENCYFTSPSVCQPLRKKLFIGRKRNEAIQSWCYEIQQKKIDYINKQMNGTGYEVRVKNSEGIKLDRTGCITREKLGISRLTIHLLFS